MKLFFSADIVGSTKYKQPFRIDADIEVILSVEHRKEWQDFVQKFYNDLSEGFPKAFAEMRDNVLKLKVRDTTNPDEPEQEPKPEYVETGMTERHKTVMAGYSPVLWKTLGDEIIFWKQLDHEHQIWISLAAWLKAIEEARKPFHGRGLDIKSTVWLAEFPVRNALVMNPLRDFDSEAVEVGLLTGVAPLDAVVSGTDHAREEAIASFYRRKGRRDYVVDFIGPGIDTGFRVAKYSTTRNMALSVDVAYLMAVSRLTLEGEDKGEFRYGPAGNGNSPASCSVTYKCKLASGLKSHKLVRSHLVDLEIPQGLQFATSGSKNRALDLATAYGGGEVLKGILGGIDYPRFWIDIGPENSLDARRSLMEGRGKVPPTNWEDILRFCLSFYYDRKGYLRPPVLLGSEGLSATLHPEWVGDYEKCLRAIQ